LVEHAIFGAPKFDFVHRVLRVRNSGIAVHIFLYLRM
jgi:hypothetical protein